jgi:hypothetical protein
MTKTEWMGAARADPSNWELYDNSDCCYSPVFAYVLQSNGKAVNLA